MAAYQKYTRAMLAEAAATSLSVADVLRRLGIRWTGGSHAHISRSAEALRHRHLPFRGEGARQGQEISHPAPLSGDPRPPPAGVHPREGARAAPGVAGSRAALRLRRL
ncbi:hypothetical protein ACFSTC_46120 [Nonomuraea ferruginea]